MEGNSGLNSGVPLDSTGAVVTKPRQNRRPPTILYFTQAIGDEVNMTVDAAIDDRTVTVDDTTNFTDGTYVGVFSGESGENRFYFGTQVGAPAAGVVTLDTPLDFAFETGDLVQAFTRDMGVDGSGDPEIFEVRGPAAGDLQLEITRIMFSFVTDSPVSLSEFGDIPALALGLVLRKRDGIYQNILNAKTNAEIQQICFDYDPHSALNPAQGQDGAAFRMSFGGPDKMDCIVPLLAAESLEAIIQDDLRLIGTATSQFRMIAEGNLIEMPM